MLSSNKKFHFYSLNLILTSFNVQRCARDRTPVRQPVYPYVLHQFFLQPLHGTAPTFPMQISIESSVKTMLSCNFTQRYISSQYAQERFIQRLLPTTTPDCCHIFFLPIIFSEVQKGFVRRSRLSRIIIAFIQKNLK